MAKKAFLAIDLGAESGRAIVGCLADEQLELVEIHRFRHLVRQLPSGLHWDLTGIWANVVEGVRKSIQWCSKEGVELVSLGVDAWGVDFGLVGASGELLGLPHCYRDERNVRAFEKAVADVGSETIYNQTGIQLMAINTLFQVLAGKDAEPAILENTDKLLMIPDLFHFFFTGRGVNEATVASTSQMTDPQSGDWQRGFLQRLGIPTKCLGEIVPPGTRIGPLLPHVAKEVNAPEGLEVIAPATHDTAAAVAAVPADTATNWCYVSSGTWSLMGAELHNPCLTEAAREAPFTHERGVGNTIRFLKNIIGLWLVQECRRAFEREGKTSDYAELTRAAAEAEPFRTILDPDHPPFMLPGEMPEKIADYARSTGQPEPRTPGEFVRCCLETLALTYRRTITKLADVTDQSFDVLHIVGGGSRNELLNQLAADATGCRVVAGPEEATAIGNVLTQGLGTGAVRDLAHIRSIVTKSFQPKTYEAAGGPDWDEAYDRFMKLRGES